MQEKRSTFAARVAEGVVLYRMSAIGTSRHFAAPRNLVAIGA
jgi:hypothetical protein